VNQRIDRAFDIFDLKRLFDIIIGADGKAAQRPVEVGDWVGQDWIIRKGLNDGDTVILDNLMKLNPGVAVVAQAAAAAASN